MAVYKRGYQGYAGRLTPEWMRFLVIARYAYRGVFDSKLLTTFFVFCYIVPVVCAIFIYLPHNAAVVEFIARRSLIAIDGNFFFHYLSQQAVFAYLLTAFIGPGLVAADLANNALPLYFCRSFTRTEYVLGKVVVLGFLLSAITWIPGLLLIGFQVGLVGFGWLADNWWIAWAMLVGSLVWVVVLCLLALAVSALVKRRVVAGGVILGIFFIPAGFGAALDNALRTSQGSLLNIVSVLERIWTDLFRTGSRSDLNIEAAWMAVAAGCALCLFLLNRKVRAYEVVKS